jgi:hypothetical protein
MDYTKKTEKEILDDIDKHNPLSLHFNNGFRLHHIILKKSSQRSYLKYIVDNNFSDYLTKVKKLTLDEYCMIEKLESGMVSVIKD